MKKTKNARLKKRACKNRRSFYNEGMNRNLRKSATILACKTVGEQNRLVTMLTAEDGVCTALLYGGPKSKLRSLVSPYHTGTVWLYTDTVRKSTKITDFDVVNFRPALRENLYKSWAAALCSELLIKTCATGGEVFTIVNGFLDGLNISSEQAARAGTVRFLWRYQQELGVQCDTQFCTLCGAEFGQFAGNMPGLYSAVNAGFLCPHCAADGLSSSDKGFSVSVEGINYLNGVTNLAPKLARTLPLSESSFHQLEELCFFLTNQAADGHLKSFESLHYLNYL